MRKFILLVIAFSFLMGFYQSTKSIFFDIPALMDTENRHRVHYDSVRTVILGSGTDYTMFVYGRDMINNKLVGVRLGSICNLFKDTNCDTIRNRIKSTGITLLTGFNASGKGVIVENKSDAEIINPQKAYAKFFAYFMIPGIVYVLFLIGKKVFKNSSTAVFLFLFPAVCFSQISDGLILEPTGFYSVNTIICEAQALQL